MKGTKILLSIIGVQLLTLIVFDVVEMVKTPETPTVSSICVKEDTNTTICYCRGQF